jgi:predicted  nucleic acid-binding Zn-ribbon protein
MTGADDLRTWFGFFQWAITALAGFYAWNANRQSAKSAEVTALTLRVATLEEQMRHLPDADLINELAGDMKAVQAELKGLKESLAPLQRSIERVNDYLLNQKG